MLIHLSNDPTAICEDAKWAFTTRRVDRKDVCSLSKDFASVKSGDLVLGRVSTIGQHKGVQLTTGRRSILYPGDFVVTACGARYAPDQFEGVAEIDAKGADLLAGGGCLGRMTQKNVRVSAPTKVEPVGILTRTSGAVINLIDYAMPSADKTADIPVLAVFGSSMNAGKTTAATALVRGLKQAGWNVAALKGTGTGAFGDFNAVSDAGARFVADFTDAGMVSTYLQPLPQVKAAIRTLIAQARAYGADMVVLEIADGLFQKETAALLNDDEFRSWLSGAVFACGDPLAAAGGVAALTLAKMKPAVLTGVLSCSPMSSAEAYAATGVPVLTKQDLSDPAEASALANSLIHPVANVA